MQPLITMDFLEKKEKTNFFVSESGRKVPCIKSENVQI